MANAQVISGKVMEETAEVSLAADHQSLTSEDKSNLNFSFESSPLLDKEKIKRCSARSTDEFWDALSSNYDYLMDDGLIATCREASSDLSLDDENELPESCYWSFSQFIEQFKWLHDLLHNLQVAKEGENNQSDSKIVDEQQKIVYLCKLFNDQAQTLSKRYPDMRDEVHRHLNRLNNKWKAVEQSINPNKVKSPSKDCVFNEITNRMRSLRKWLREIEQRLIPVNLATNWNLESLDKRYKEQVELQKEIESQGKYVSTLRKLCEHLKGNVRFGQNSLMVWDAERVRKVACNLEHRWHALWLKSLECHCILEDLIQNCAKHSDKLDKSFTDEPLKKYPRLSGACEELLLLENELREKMSSKVDEKVTADESLLCNNHIQQTDLPLHRDGYTLKNDKGVMVGDTGIAELKAECQSGNGKFEIIQDVGYSSETSAHFSNDEKIDSPETHCLKDFENGTYVPATSICNVSHDESTPKVILAPDKYPSVALKTLYFLSEDKPLFNSKFGSCRTVPDTFYKMASVDDEIFEDNADVSTKIDVPSELLCKKTLNINQNVNSKIVEVSNEISHLNLNSNAQSHEKKVIPFKEDSVTKQTVPSDINLSPNSTLKRNKKSIKSSINVPVKPVESDQQWKKNAKVHEWLNTCQSADDGTSDDNLEVSEKSSKTEWSRKTADSSCDASGEYTTTESDSERSNVSDVNNSITFSQSFTGSIETVIPAVPEESCVVQSDRAGSTEPSPGVRMRKKKRVARDRPWSVTDVNQTFVSPSFPHSTSESALDMLYSAQDSKKMGSKNLGSENKRFSLTDISTLSGSSMKSLKINLKGLKSSFLDKAASRRKKGSDQSDSSPCQLPERQSTPKHASASLNAVSSIIEDKSEKASVHEVSSLETSMVSENEKSESVINLEDHGSISWDEYQDPPYLSEPYSEQTADEDEVKKLINFGDDYRAMLGSYSDNSSISLKAPPSKIHRTRSKSSWHKGSSQESRDSLMSDSNSDSEDFHHIMKTSNRALLVVSNTLKENMQKMTSFSKEFAELVATCQTNLCNLHSIHTQLVSGCELEALSKEDILKLQDLIKDWEALQVKLLTLSQNDNEKSKNAELEAAVIDVHCSLAALKEKLTVMATSATDAGEAVESLSQLKRNIQNLQAGLSNVQEMKDSVLSVTARILRIIAEGGGPAITPLRDNATKLYQQWEDVYELNCSQLTKLQGLQQRWHESTESEMNSSSETTVQWHPVQVGDSLPTPQVSTEGFYQSTAAEVQVADQNDVLFEIETESTKAMIQCYIENENDDFSDPIHLLSPPAVKTGTLRDLPEEEDAAEISNTRKLSCFWRTLRATVPIQFALVILYCMSSLMEPQCCDNMNNYDFSLFPHLRYLRGPPPV